jgi:hypothetical protein
MYIYIRGLTYIHMYIHIGPVLENLSCGILGRRVPDSDCHCMLHYTREQGQRWWQRCFLRTLMLQACLIRYFVEDDMVPCVYMMVFM